MLKFHRSITGTKLDNVRDAVRAATRPPARPIPSADPTDDDDYMFKYKMQIAKRRRRAAIRKEAWDERHPEKALARENEKLARAARLAMDEDED